VTGAVGSPREFQPFSAGKRSWRFEQTAVGVPCLLRGLFYGLNIVVEGVSVGPLLLLAVVLLAAYPP
jgi:hypothetical protein